MTDISTLEPCPRCGKLEYTYGFSFMEFLGETLRSVPEAVSPGAIARVLTSVDAGLGIFSVPKSFYQAVFLELDGHPLLRCKHCNAAVVACIKCGFFMLLERKPGTAELVECPTCKARFQLTERDDTFDKLLGKDS